MCEFIRFVSRPHLGRDQQSGDLLRSLLSARLYRRLATAGGDVVGIVSGIAVGETEPFRLDPPPASGWPSNADFVKEPVDLPESQTRGVIAYTYPISVDDTDISH